MYQLNVSVTNEDKGYLFGQWTEDLDEDLYLNDDGTPNTGEIYRQCQREYGRCTSSVYNDTAKGVVRVGWFFVSRQRYEDTGEPYLRGAWVTIQQTLDYPTITRVEV